MSEAKPEAKAGDKTSLNTCYDALQSKVDQALLQLSGLEQTLKIGTPAPHKLKTYEALRDVLDSMKAVDESTMLLDNLPEKERPQIPSKLLEWLDDGKDPDAFYKHLIDDTIWGSQVCNHDAPLHTIVPYIGRALCYSVLATCAETLFQLMWTVVGNARQDVCHVSWPHQAQRRAQPNTW